MRRAVSIAVGLVLLLAVYAAARQARGSSDNPSAYRGAMEDADQKIADEVRAHSELMKNLEHLTTAIGPRLTGSPQMQAASDWTLQRFKDYGLDAHLETTHVAHAWTRGTDTAAIVSPIQRTIEIRSAGWSRATDGEIRGRVVFVDPVTRDAVEAKRAVLKGAIVCLGAPLPPISDLEPNPANAYDAVIPPPRGVAHGSTPSAAGVNEALRDAGAALVLRDSRKTDSLFNMGLANQPAYEPSILPSAFVTREDYALLYRLAQTGSVTLAARLNGTFSPGEVAASITVAEITGTEHPDERVIVGGHLDSWDLGQGALDNGTGSMAVLEAARALHALGWRPKRTLTFVLFTGEEEGGVGANLFIRNHSSEVPKIDAVLIDDTGTGRVFSIALEDLHETVPLMSRVYEPLQEVFDLEPLSTRNFGASDHEPFLHAGVPAYFCVQKPARYGQAHHSQTDTFDKVIPEDVNEGAALLAAWMWNVSELTPALPHHAAR